MISQALSLIFFLGCERNALFNIVRYMISSVRLNKMNENSTPNSPLLLKSGSSKSSPSTSPSQMEGAISKQQSLIDKNIESLKQLETYKSKALETIKQNTERLESEKAKTKDTLNSINLRNQEELKNLNESYEKALDEIRNTPLFQYEAVKTYKTVAKTLRKQNVELRSNFTTSYAKFMEEFHANCIIVKQVFKNVSARNSSTNLALIKNHIVSLQNSIQFKCKKINRSTEMLDVSTPVKLVISEPSNEDAAIEAYKKKTEEPKVETKSFATQITEAPIIACTSDFVSKFFIKNASLLSK